MCSINLRFLYIFTQECIYLLIQIQILLKKHDSFSKLALEINNSKPSLTALQSQKF